MVRWHTFAAGADGALDDEDIQAVLEVSAQTIDAALANDADAFDTFHAPECMVNNPVNRVVSGELAVKLMRQGLIHYDSFDRRVEYAGKHGEMVVVMGEETVTPKPPSPQAGQTVRRRFTDVWRKVEGAWKVSARQATDISAG